MAWGGLGFRVGSLGAYFRFWAGCLEERPRQETLDPLCRGKHGSGVQSRFGFSAQPKTLTPTICKPESLIPKHLHPTLTLNCAVLSGKLTKDHRSQHMSYKQYFDGHGFPIRDYIGHGTQLQEGPACPLLRVPL